MSAAGEHDAVAVGDTPRVLEQIWPHTLIAPEHVHLRTIGIDRPQTLRPPQRFVGVFPPRVDHAAVVHHGRKIVRLVVARDKVDVVAVGITSTEHVGIGRRHAANIGVAARRRKQDVFAVGQIDRIEIVIDGVGQLTKMRSVGVDLIKVKRLFVVRLETEENVLAVVRNIGPPKRSVQRFDRHELFQFAAR